MNLKQAKVRAYEIAYGAVVNAANEGQAYAEDLTNTEGHKVGRELQKIILMLDKKYDTAQRAAEEATK